MPNQIVSPRQSKAYQNYSSKHSTNPGASLPREPYSGWHNWDTWAVSMVVSGNYEEQDYRQAQAWQKNWEKKEG